MKSLPKLLLPALMLLVIFTACKPAVPQNDDGKLHVAVSILPQAYFVERIGGEYVNVDVMVAAGQEAHSYEPKADQMKALSTTDVFFAIGIEYEDIWLPKFQAVNPQLLIVDSSAGITRLPMLYDHDEGEEEDDDHAEEGSHLDPHIWLSPHLAKVIVQNITTRLIALDPAHEAVFGANAAVLLMEIDQLDQEIQAVFDAQTSRKFIVFHPAWGYFAADYGLEMLPIEIGGQEPSPRELAQLVDLAKAEDIHVIFAQPNFSGTDAEALAKEIDGVVLKLDPLAKDWLVNMQNVAAAIAEALK